jgi:hypothetical protein
MHTAITCIRRVTCEWVVGGVRAGTMPCAGTRAHRAASGRVQTGPQSAAAASWQGAARAMYRCSEVSRLSDDERRPFGHFETRSGPGNGQHQPYPGNWYGVSAPYTTAATESPTRLTN